MEENINVRVNTEKKAKAIFMLKTQGKTLSQAVREMTDKLAEEFDKKNSKQRLLTQPIYYTSMISYKNIKNIYARTLLNYNKK